MSIFCCWQEQKLIKILKKLGLGFTTLQSNLDNVLDMTKNPFLEYAHYIALNKSVSADVVASIESAMEKLTDNGKIDGIMDRYR